MARPGNLTCMNKIVTRFIRNRGIPKLQSNTDLHFCQPKRNYIIVGYQNGKTICEGHRFRDIYRYRYTKCGGQQRSLHSARFSIQSKLNQNDFLHCGSNNLPLTSGGRPTVHTSLLIGQFHTTPRAYIPPVIWLFIKPAAKITAMLSGRFARKWWQALPDKKRIFCKANIKKNLHWIALSGVALSGLAYAYYRSHLQETPITKRVRFLAVTDEQFMKIAEHEAKMHLTNYEEMILPVNHPLTKKVVELTRCLVSRNQDLPTMKDKKWTVAVVDKPDRNAFVLPTGHIFVFTGLLDTAQSDDQLAIVLGHELAHAILSHAAEQLSFMQLVDWMIIVVMAAIWTIMPTDGIALVTQWFYHKVVDFVVHMPYSRKLEKEADKVGLHLCAKACFDVRESSAFWTIMDALGKVEDGNIPEWLSTHPSNENRVKHLDFLIPKAIQERASCSCPALPPVDPRDRAKPIQEGAADIVRAKRAGINIKQVHLMPNTKKSPALQTV